MNYASIPKPKSTANAYSSYSAFLIVYPSNFIMRWHSSNINNRGSNWRGDVRKHHFSKYVFSAWYFNSFDHQSIGIYYVILKWCDEQKTSAQEIKIAGVTIIIFNATITFPAAFFAFMAAWYSAKFAGAVLYRRQKNEDSGSVSQRSGSVGISNKAVELYKEISTNRGVMEEKVVPFPTGGL